MKKQTNFEGVYVAPNLNLFSTEVEAGFTLSAGIADAEENNYGNF